MLRDLSIDDLRTRIGDECLQHALRFPEVYRTYQEQYRVLRTREQVEQRQRDRLNRLLGSVLTTVPALRRLDLGWTPEADPFTILPLLPTMRKAELLAGLADHVADGFDPARCCAVRTSGTTGEPLRILHSQDHFVHSCATELARLIEAGLPFDRKTLLPFKMGGGGWFEYTMVTTGFNRVAEFGFLDRATDDERRVVADWCVQFEPDVVFSHPSRCVSLVQLLSDAGITQLSVPMVRTFGEKLTAPVRQLLAEFFGAEVRDSYGMNEFSTVAAECVEGRMHLDEERLWVEVLDQAGAPVPDGVEGEITVTNLLNAVMPFVRYRTGDIGSVQAVACECGQPTRALVLLTGRDYGEIRLPDGRTVEALRVVRALEQFPLRRFQVVQPDLAQLTILVTPINPTPIAAGWLDRVAASVEAVVGDRLPARVVPVGIDDYRGADRSKAASFVSLLPEQQLTPL